MREKFKDLSEEELIKILDQGDLLEEEFVKLLKTMEEKGLSGSIMVVSSEEELETAKEYIEYHKKLPKTYPRISKEDINNAKDVLFNSLSNVEDKKRSLIILAHVETMDAYETLKEYQEEAAEELRLWVDLAINECQSFLTNNIMDKPTITVNKIS